MPSLKKECCDKCRDLQFNSSSMREIALALDKVCKCHSGPENSEAKSFAGLVKATQDKFTPQKQSEWELDLKNVLKEIKSYYQGRIDEREKLLSEIKKKKAGR